MNKYLLLLLTLVTLPVAASPWLRAGHSQNTGAVSFGKQGTYGTGGCFAAGQQSSQSAGVKCGISGSGPNGNSFSGASKTLIQNGVGAAHSSGYSAETARGNFMGQRTASYNAQTGTGSRSAVRSADTNQDGVTDYGYTLDTSYQRGIGRSTTVQTQNKGTYNCAAGSSCIQNP